MELISAQVEQWREYSFCQIQRCASEKELADKLMEMDTYLSQRVYFAGESYSEADLSMFWSLHTVLMNLGFSEKENYRNVSRWFNNIQHKRGGAGDVTQIIFMKCPIYLPSLV